MSIFRHMTCQYCHSAWPSFMNADHTEMIVLHLNIVDVEIHVTIGPLLAPITTHTGIIHLIEFNSIQYNMHLLYNGVA